MKKTLVAKNTLSLSTETVRQLEVRDLAVSGGTVTRPPSEDPAKCGSLAQTQCGATGFCPTR